MADMGSGYTLIDLTTKIPIGRAKDVLNTAKVGSELRSEPVEMPGGARVTLVCTVRRGREGKREFVLTLEVDGELKTASATWRSEVKCTTGKGRDENS